MQETGVLVSTVRILRTVNQLNHHKGPSIKMDDSVPMGSLPIRCVGQHTFDREVYKSTAQIKNVKY